MKIAILNKNQTIKEAIIQIKESSFSIGLVLDGKILIGVLTQGDILKFIYTENTFFGKVNDLMSIEYLYATDNENINLLDLHKKYKIPYIPIIDINKNLIGLSSIFSENIIFFEKI